jgi:hypothetical protein
VRNLASKEVQQQREEAVLRGLLGARSDYESERAMEAFSQGIEGMFSCEDCGSKRTGYV